MTYPFDVDLAPSSVGPGITPTLDSTFALIYVADDGFGNVLEAYPTEGSVSAATAKANDSYFTLTLDSASQPFGLLTVSFDVAKGGWSDPRGYLVQSSVDGYTSNLLEEVLPSGANAAPDTRTFLLDAMGLNSVSLRFYVWTPDYESNSVDFRNLSVSDATVPEPAPFGLLCLGLGGLALYRRRS